MINSAEAYDELPFGVYILNESQTIVFWNTQMEVYTGYSKKDMVGISCGELSFFEDENANYRLNFSNCISKEGELQLQTFIKTKNNELLPTFTSLKKIIFKNQPCYLISVTDFETIVKCDYYISRTCVTEDKTKAFHGIVGNHEKMKDIFRLIQLSAESEANILIQGESGTGKELIASAIHDLSERHDKPFIKVNCAALSESLLESELFGHVKGAFTGAIHDKIGKFEAANNGTLFLDEIGEISQNVQVKLLRVLQERVIERVGETKSRKINIRLITATNKNLTEEIEANRFREDLYYRLKVFPITTIPLRDRKVDIPHLIQHFIEKLNKKTGKKIQTISDEALKLMMSYSWRGNVRELENTLEYAFILCAGTEITSSDLPNEFTQNEQKIETQSQIISVQNSVKKEDLIDILNQHNGSRKDTAASLGISTVALWKKMKKYELI